MPTELEQLRAQLEAEREAHAAEVAGYRAALAAIKKDPFGCRFCDSGRLRNAEKGHDEWCGFLQMEAALAAPPTAAVEAVEGMRMALEAAPCRCSVLLKCPHCGGEVVEGADQFSGSWICGACVKTVNLPKDPTRPCARCAALAAWKEATRD